MADTPELPIGEKKPEPSILLNILEADYVKATQDFNNATKMVQQALGIMSYLKMKIDSLKNPPKPVDKPTKPKK